MMRRCSLNKFFPETEERLAQLGKKFDEDLQKIMLSSTVPEAIQNAGMLHREFLAADANSRSNTVESKQNEQPEPDHAVGDPVDDATDTTFDKTRKRITRLKDKYEEDTFWIKVALGPHPNPDYASDTDSSNIFYDTTERPQDLSTIPTPPTRKTPTRKGGHYGAVRETEGRRKMYLSLKLAPKRMICPAKKIEYPPLTAFELFPRLPKELRLVIWELARQEPRIVKLRKSKMENYMFGRYNYRSNAPIPGLLHTCIESRLVALQWYASMFPECTGDSYSYTMLGAPIKIVDPFRKWGTRGLFQNQHTFFDPSADFLYIGCEFCTIHLDLQSCKKVQNLLIRWNENRSPFFSFASWYPSATEIGILSPSSGDSKAGTSLTQLKESSEVFSWQQGKGLMEIYSEDAEESPGWSFPAKKITCVELAITPQTSKDYGFLEERFRNMSLDLTAPQTHPPSSRRETSLRQRNEATKRSKERLAKQNSKTPNLRYDEVVGRDCAQAMSILTGLRKFEPMQLEWRFREHQCGL